VTVFSGTWYANTYAFTLKGDNSGLSFDIVEDRDGDVHRWHQDRLGFKEILRAVIFEMHEDPETVFRKSGKTALGAHYEVTAKWLK